MLNELLTHFFLLPHMTPAFSSRSTSRNSASIAGGPCLAIWRTNARIIAELLTDRPRKSEASRLKRWRRVSTSWVRVWVRIRKGCFGGLVCGRFIGELISHPKTIGQRKTKYIQKRAADGGMNGSYGVWNYSSSSTTL